MVLTTVVENLSQTVKKVVIGVGKKESSSGKSRRLPSSSSSNSEPWEPSPDRDRRKPDTRFQYQCCHGNPAPNGFDQYQHGQFDCQGDRDSTFERGRRSYENEYGKYHLRMEIPIFNSHIWIKEVLDLLTEVERFFKVVEIPEKQKVKLVSVRHKSRTFVWWDQSIRHKLLDPDSKNIQSKIGRKSRN